MFHRTNFVPTLLVVSEGGAEPIVLKSIQLLVVPLNISDAEDVLPATEIVWLPVNVLDPVVVSVPLVGSVKVVEPLSVKVRGKFPDVVNALPSVTSPPRVSVLFASLTSNSNCLSAVRAVPVPSNSKTKEPKSIASRSVKKLFFAMQLFISGDRTGDVRPQSIEIGQVRSR